MTAPVSLDHLDEPPTPLPPLPEPPTSWGRVAAVFAGGLVLFAAGFLYGHLVYPPRHDTDAGLTDVDRACVSVLHNGGMPEDCSRMYHLMPIP